MANMSQNLVVVQAASGLLGGHVVKDLLDNGFRVRAIVRSGSSKDKLSMLQNLKKQFESQLEIESLSNLSDLNEYDRFYRDARYAVFSASPYRVDLPNAGKYRDDVIMTLQNAFHAIRKYQNTIKKVVYIASVAALVDLDNLVLQKEKQQRPASVQDRNANPALSSLQPYDYLQLQAVDEVRRLASQLSIPTNIFFTGFVVGPLLETSRHSGNVMDWIALYLRDQFDSKKQRVYCYSNAQDVALAIRAALGNDSLKTGQDYIVAEANPTHPMKVYDAFRSQKEDLIKFKPSNEEKQRMLEDAQRFKQMTALDTTKTDQDLGVKPQDSEKSLSIMIKSVIDQNLISSLSA